MSKSIATTYQLEGYHWHPRCAGGEPHYMLTARTHTQRVLGYVPAGRHVAIQAGGHCGLWVKQLAAEFENVYTFEPDMDNFRCLLLNACSWNVFPFRAFLGDVVGSRELVVGARSGSGQAGPRERSGVPTLCIDQLAPTQCDLICLDVEGYETPALLGAAETIKKFSPIILTEMTGKVSADGRQFDAGTTRDWLQTHDYRQIDQIDKDVIWARS